MSRARTALSGVGYARELALPEDLDGLLALLSACEADGACTGDLVHDPDEKLGDGREICGIERRTHDHETSDGGIFDDLADGDLEIRGERVSADIDGVGDACDLGKALFDGRYRLGCELGRVAVGGVVRRIGGHDPETARIGDDGEFALLHGAAGGEHQQCVEELVEVHGPVDVELLENDVVHGIGTRDGPSVRRSCPGTGNGLTGLEHDDGFVDRHLLNGFDEFLAVVETLGIDPDDLGVGVFRIVFDDLGFVDIAFVTEGDEVGETDTVGTCPIEDGRSYCTGLGHDRDVTDRGHQVREGVVDTVPDVHSAEAVGPGDADTRFFGLFGDLFLEFGTLGAVLFESGGEDRHAFDACGGTVLHGLKHEDVLDRDDGKLDVFGYLGDI